MRVLSIDPGYGRCGVAVLEGDGSRSALLYSSCIETPAKSMFAERLLVVATEVIRLIETYTPETIAIEELYFTNNAKTALRVAEIRGMLIYLAVARGIPLVEYNPLAIKIALTGYGKAGKDQVTKMVEQILHIHSATMLDDECDAIALGLTALASSRYAALKSR